MGHGTLSLPLPTDVPTLSPMTDDEAGADERSAGHGNGNGALTNGTAAAGGASNATAGGKIIQPASSDGYRSASPEDDFPIHVEIPTRIISTIPPVSRGTAPIGVSWEDSWESPNGRFEEFVAEVVRRRVGKYEQSDHPNQLSRDEAANLFSAIRKEIIAKEVSAYDARQKASQFKPIERKKLESRIKDYVRERVRKYHLRGQ